MMEWMIHAVNPFAGAGRGGPPTLLAGTRRPTGATTRRTEPAGDADLAGYALMTPHQSGRATSGSRSQDRTRPLCRVDVVGVQPSDESLIPNAQELPTEDQHGEAE